MDTQELRKCLGKFTTGVTVVTCKTETGKHGFTVNSFTSVSLDPPLILICVDRRTKAAKYLVGKPFSITILSSVQEKEALHFAGKPQDSFIPEWVEGECAPYLKGALASLQCEPWKSYEEGDHFVVLGKVKTFTHTKSEPLIFYNGQLMSMPLVSESKM